MLPSGLETQPSRTLNTAAWTVNSNYPALSCLSICFFLVCLFGCDKRNATIAGVTIPVPPQMKAMPDKSFAPIPGFEDGQVAYQGNVSPDDIFTFYQENMGAQGWKPTTFMVTQKDQIAYTKGDRICLVWYTPSADGTTTLIIMIGTSKPPA